jgi:hypothetical protein
VSLRSRDVVVLVAARFVPLDCLALTRVTDLAPFKRQRTIEIEQYLSRHPLA